MTIRLKTLWYNRGENKLSNIYEVKNDWNWKLRAVFGFAGIFMDTGSYYYENKESAEELPSAFNEDRVKIYAMMWMAVKDEARYEAMKDPDFAKTAVCRKAV